MKYACLFSQCGQPTCVQLCFTAVFPGRGAAEHVLHLFELEVGVTRDGWVDVSNDYLKVTILN